MMTNVAQLLHNLIYIYEALNVSYSHLHCDGIYLNDDGEIKISKSLYIEANDYPVDISLGDVRKSMIQVEKVKDVSCDV